jgi:penicillin G amidase
MSPAVAKRLRLLASAVSILILLIAIVAVWFYWRVGQSRARLDGETRLVGLSAAVTVERDSVGVPTVRAASRIDASRALGFLHAQERFFQMDLSRRRSAGELSELFGKGALDFDRFARLHGFRRIAQTVLNRISEAERKLVEAYTEGVNAGLAQLSSSPFEYVLLGVAPAAWKAEDSVLIIFTMTIDLQSATGNYEQSLSCARDLLGDATVDFFAPLIGPNDAALDGSSAPLRPMPTERQLDLRKRVSRGIRDSLLAMPGSDPEAVPGSNCFALGGAHSERGRTAGERHAPGIARAQRVVPSLSGMARHGRQGCDGPSRDGSELAWNAGNGGREQWPHCLGLHEFRSRYQRSRLGQPHLGGLGCLLQSN